MSDDGRHGLNVIAFIGSVFSPYYAWARRRGAADPRDHCAVNIALYGPRTKHWAMTERRRGSLHQDSGLLAIGNSALRWNSDALTIDLDEITVPWPSRIRGQIRLHPNALTDYKAILDPQKLHRWRPIAPSSRVEVKLQSPAMHWSGTGYFDSNDGEAPLADALQSWNWSRSNLRDGVAVIYDVIPHHGDGPSLAVKFDQRGQVSDFERPPAAPLPRSAWHIQRSTRADRGEVSIVRTVEDTPFYARSIVSSRLLGEPVSSFHESLNLDRFRSPLVQAMLPFRMPRARR